MQHIQAIIWDCDGCLIDSEPIACSIAAAHYTRAGFTIDAQGYIDRFAGKRGGDIAQEINNELGSGLGDELLRRVDHEKLKAETLAAFESDLKPVSGIHDVLAALQTMPMAIASGSGMQRLDVSLSVTGLKPYFPEHVYSAELVEQGKPAPDIFLYAAEKLNVSPHACLVIEDGPSGVTGACAAGMQVFGFIGASHGSQALAGRLKAAGAHDVLSDIAVLPHLLQTEAA